MENTEVETQIFLIRGQRVILGPDLADMYRVETRVLAQAVRRNPFRFPPDFMFQLNAFELETLVRSRSQSVILKRGMNVKFRPLAFTEQGVAMLSSVLRSRKAVEINIAIMRAFVKLRHAFMVRRDIAMKVERLEGRVNLVETDVRLLREDFQEKNPKISAKPNPKVKGFEG